MVTNALQIPTETSQQDRTSELSFAKEETANEGPFTERADIVRAAQVGDARPLVPLKRFVVQMKLAGNNQSKHYSPRENTQQNEVGSSFQSVYEQLGNTRLMSGQGSHTGSPHGKPELKFAKSMKSEKPPLTQKQAKTTKRDSCLDKILESQGPK